MDSCWQAPEKYTTMISEGHSPLLQFYRQNQKFGCIPGFLLHLMVKELHGYVAWSYGADHRISFLSGEQSDNFEAGLLAVSEFIDADAILDSEILSPLHRIGLLTRFKKANPLQHRLFIDAFDNRGLLRLRYFDDGLSRVEIFVNSRQIVPAFTRAVWHSFNRRPYVAERISWIPFDGLRTWLSW